MNGAVKKSKLLRGLPNKLCQNKLKTCRPAGGLQKQLQLQPQSLKTETCNQLIFMLVNIFFTLKRNLKLFLNLQLRLKNTKSRTVPPNTNFT